MADSKLLLEKEMMIGMMMEMRKKALQSLEGGKSNWVCGKNSRTSTLFMKYDSVHLVRCAHPEERVALRLPSAERQLHSRQLR